MKTLPHSGVRQEEIIHLPAMPPFPRQAATQAAAPKQVPAAQTLSSERVTCKLPPLQATASASSAAGRAKALGTEAHSHQELLPPLPCISGDRDKAVRGKALSLGQTSQEQRTQNTTSPHSSASKFEEEPAPCPTQPHRLFHSTVGHSTVPRV